MLYSNIIKPSNIIIIIIKVQRNSRSPFVTKEVNSVAENKSKELWK